MGKAVDAPTSHSYSIVRKFLYLLSAQWTREVLQSLFLIYLARTSTSTYGEFMLALSMGQVLLFIAEFGINQKLVSVLSKTEEDTFLILLHVSVVKFFLLICGLAWTWAFSCWLGYSGSLKAVIMVIGTGVGIEALASSFFIPLQLKGRQDLEGRVRVLGAGLGFGFGFATLYFGLPAIMVGCYKLIETLANLGGILLVTLKRIRAGLLRLRLKICVDIMRDSFVLSLISLTAIFYNKTNIFFLQRFGDSEAVAQYSATWQIVDGVSCLASNLLLRNILFPLFADLWETRPEQLAALARNAAKWLITVSLPIMFLLLVESDRLIPLIYGSGYGDAVWMQKYLVITILIAFMHNLAAYLMISVKQEKLLLLIYLIGLAFNLVCCIWIIPGRPLLGTALAIILTKGIVAVMTVSFCQKQFGILPFRSILSIAAACIAGLALFYFTGRFTYREVAAVAALVPLAALAGIWWLESRAVRQSAPVSGA